MKINFATPTKEPLEEFADKHGLELVVFDSTYRIPPGYRVWFCDAKYKDSSGGKCGITGFGRTINEAVSCFCKQVAFEEMYINGTGSPVPVPVLIPRKEGYEQRS